jgi:hypothetical protein
MRYEYRSRSIDQFPVYMCGFLLVGMPWFWSIGNGAPLRISFGTVMACFFFVIGLHILVSSFFRLMRDYSTGSQVNVSQCRLEWWDCGRKNGMPAQIYSLDAAEIETIEIQTFVESKEIKLWTFNDGRIETFTSDNTGWNVEKWAEDFCTYFPHVRIT